MISKRFSPFVLLALASAAVMLTGCVASTPATSWPGLASNGQLAFVANDQQVHAIDLTSGKELWAFPNPKNANAGLFFSDPAFDETTVLVGSEGPANSFSGALYALDIQTGAQKWCLAFDQKGAQRTQCPNINSGQAGGLFGIASPEDNRLLGGLTIADGVAYFGLASGQIYAVDLSTGQKRWSFGAGHAVWGAPTLDETAGVVYIASLDHYVYALQLADGGLIWKKNLGAAIGGQIVLYRGLAYVGAFDNNLYALDAQTGETQWQYQAGNWVWGAPTVFGDVIYITDLSGALTAIDLASGQKQWSVTPGGVLRATPAVTADAIYLGDRSGNLFALNRADGSLKWQQTLKGELLTTPVLVADKIVLAVRGGDNLLTAYTDVGALKWAFAPSK